MASDDMNEVVTRGILKEELAKEFQMFEQRFERKLDHKLERKFSEFRELIRQDTAHTMQVLLEQMQTQLRLALEPTNDLRERVSRLELADLPTRVASIEAADLPARMTKLEARALPAKGRRSPR